MNIQETKLIRIVDYLKRLGYTPSTVRNSQYWYLSPFRDEKTPSFKVNDRENLWYDFGIAEGGDLIELGKHLYRTHDLNAVLRELEKCSDIPSLHIRSPNIPQKSVATEIIVEGIRPLTNPALLSYIKSRDVDVPIAQCFCREIHYRQCKRHYFGICFENRSGGFEVRNAYFKGCVKNKDVTVVMYSQDERQSDICVFEGFMDFLAYLTLQGRNDTSVCIQREADHIILNSVSNLKKCLEIIGLYEKIHCYLDNDLAGRKTTETIIGLYGEKSVDESERYDGYKDTNDYLRDKKL